MADRLKRNLSMDNIATVVMFAYLFLYPAFPGTTDFGLLRYTGFNYQIVLAMSVVLIWGLCGIYSFAQAAFFGLSGYCYAAIALNLPGPEMSWIAALIAIAFGFAVAAVFGYFMFYGGINHSFIGIITLCLTMLCQTFFAQTADTSKYRIGNCAFNGANGINNLPSLYIGGAEISTGFLYYLTLIILFAIVIFLIAAKHLRIGYAMIAIRENPSRASLLGYNIAKIKTLTFAAGGAIAGLAGVLYIWWGGYIVPTSMSMTSATIPIVICAAGGRKSPIASVIFGFAYLTFSNYLAYIGSEYSLIVLGLVLIVAILAVPNGFVETLFRLIDVNVLRPLLKGRQTTSLEAPNDE